MKYFRLLQLTFFILFFVTISLAKPSIGYAGCGVPAICDAPAGECGPTCNGGQPCHVNNGGFFYQCQPSNNCNCLVDGVDTGPCTTEYSGAICGNAPYYGACQCEAEEICTIVETCTEVVITPCCSAGSSNDCDNGLIDPGETCSSCPQDVGECPAVCGDGSCNGSENCSCSDCSGTPACTGGGGGSPVTCPNNFCGPGENCNNCSSDCGACTNNCGNDVCGAGETPASCPQDCSNCGNGICQANLGENCSTCSQDCGACDTAFCGDNSCNAFETCGTCAGDCGACPTDVAWWQAQAGPAYAAANSGTAIQSMVPSTCTAPACTRALTITDAAQTPLSDGFALSNGGAILTNGYSTERQPNIEVITTNLTKFRESYDFFYREYSLGENPADDFAATAGNATKPTAGTLPASGREAFFHNSNTSGVFTIQERWQVAADEQIVILIEGDMEITNPNGYDDLITVDSGGSLVFIVSGEINIDPTVGNASAANVNPNIEGVFIADGTIFIESTNDTTTEKRFVGAGSFVSWTTISLDRDLGTTNNQNIPAEFFIFRPDFVENVPDHLARPRYVWQETN